MGTVRREPPAAVRRELRREVGFGCPVDVAGRPCGNPYLECHHFDPPWHVRQHHEPGGMVALCAEHHSKADAGAFDRDQLLALKADSARHEEVRGRFDWLRRDLLTVVGGNFYYETPVAVQFREQPVVWLTRDDSGYLGLNLRMLTTATEPRLILDDNFWMLRGRPKDLECPPHGRVVDARYANGDRLRVEFVELDSLERAAGRYPDAKPERWGVSFPLTAVEVSSTVGGTPIRFGPRETRIGGGVMRNCFASHCGVGLAFG